MRHGSGHRVRAAAHHVLLFVRKPGGMSGPAHGPAKVLPIRGGADAQRPYSTAFTWGLLVLGVMLLTIVLLVAVRIARGFAGPQLIAWPWR